MNHSTPYVSKLQDDQQTLIRCSEMLILVRDQDIVTNRDVTDMKIFLEKPVQQNATKRGNRTRNVIRITTVIVCVLIVCMIIGISVGV